MDNIAALDEALLRMDHRLFDPLPMRDVINAGINPGWGGTFRFDGGTFIQTPIIYSESTSTDAQA